MIYLRSIWIMKRFKLFLTLIIHDKMVKEDNFSYIYSAPQNKMEIIGDFSKSLNKIISIENFSLI